MKGGRRGAERTEQNRFLKKTFAFSAFEVIRLAFNPFAVRDPPAFTGVFIP